MLEANELILTADGSHSLRSIRYGVEYHSTHGAIQESRHVFIAAGLEPLLATGITDLRILEMGFGTGLNALLVRQLAAQHPNVRFTYDTYERYPISPVEAAALNYPAALGLDASQLYDLHDCGWDTLEQTDPNFAFRKHHADFLDQADRPYAPGSIDLIFYDAFGPGSQPEFWTLPAMEINFAALKPGGVLVTYCAQGQFKRNLRDAGFMVEPLPGPPGKREMTRGRKVSR